MNANNSKLEINSTVKIKSFLNKTGIVTKIKSKTLLVNVNGTNVECKIEDAVLVNEKAKKKNLEKVITKKKNNNNSVPSIDLHGLSREIAKEKIENFISDTIIKGCSKCIIVHGIGKGILLKESHKILRNMRVISNFKIMENNPGSTIVYL